MLPPQMTTPTRRPQNRSGAVSTAARPAAPAPSTTKFLPLEQNLDRAFDRHIVDQQDIRDQGLNDAPSEPARLLDGDALGEGCGGGRRTGIFAAHQPVHRRIQSRLDPDDLDFGLERLGGDRDPGNQSAAANRHDDRVEIRQVGEELERDGALTRDDHWIVIGVYENQPLVAGQRVGRLAGGDEAVALE